MNQLGIAGVAFQLMSKPTDPCSEDLNIIAVFWSPYPGEQFLIEHKTASIVNKLAKQEPLGSGQVFWLTADKQVVVPKINSYIPYLENFDQNNLLG